MKQIDMSPSLQSILWKKNKETYSLIHSCQINMIVHGFVKEKKKKRRWKRDLEVVQVTWVTLGKYRDEIFVFGLKQHIFLLSFQISDFIIYKFRVLIELEIGFCVFVIYGEREMCWYVMIFGYEFYPRLKMKRPMKKMNIFGFLVLFLESHNLFNLIF